MKVLITGGAGFIGSHLSEALLSRGDEVYAIDNLSTGSIENIEPLKGNRRFHYTIDTVMNEPVLAELIDRVDVVYHLAAAVGVRLIVESPVNTIETNVHGTEMVLKIANKKKKKVMLASTSEVYGKSNIVPFREDADLVMGPTSKGRWSYACSKAIDEFLALAYHKEKKLPVVVFRLFNTVGPRQTGRYGMVIPNFVKQALMGHTLTVYGDGSQRRCFGYAWPTHRRRWARSSTSGIRRRRSRSSISRSASRRGRSRRARSRSSPTRRPTKKASRTCSAASPTSASSSARPASPPRSASTRSWTA
jgi:UDP-glucose 4-epimerase